ncbi:uncharacterized protein F5147DRAFT_657536 [Suillus discolor]|uniref:Protein kinase domain-containing protein n=1 Tax=Suillus discolor TaxID=1912936 RepID=A0A9P7EWD1_9AGAM|nr:uncharacterized protein F5147DRAFT_657536 [Suillus discolor]KAG2092922.1 hypothetical protein F5147DRAFT_657536 [Suillus discolor]
MCTIAHRTAYFSHKLLHNDINPRSVCLHVNDPSDESVIPFWNADGTPPIRQAMLCGWRFAKHMDPEHKKTSIDSRQKRTVLPSCVPNWLQPDCLPSHRLDISQERFQVEDWSSTCSACFSDYFNHPPIVNGLANLASKLSPPGSLKIKPNGSKSATFPENPVTHDDMILVLKDIVAELPVEQPPSEDDV